MLSLRQTLDRKKVPPFRQGDIRDIVTKLGLAFPTSLVQLLNNLPPAVFTINIDYVSTPGGVSASGQVGLQSDGAISFRGTVNNPHAAEGINYTYAVALLDVKDSSGNALVVSKSGNLFNLVQSSSDTFQQDGLSQLIASNWDVAKTSRTKAIILASDNVLEDVGAAIAEAFVGAGLFAVFIAIPGGEAPGPCEWGPTPGEDNQHDTPSLKGCYRVK